MSTPLARGVVAFLIGFLGAVVVIQAVDLASNGGDDGEPMVLGPLDIQAYCRNLEGDQMLAALVTDSAFGWRCVGRRNGIWGEEVVDLHQACRAQFRPGAWAETSDPAEPRSWVCVSRS
jgi:hypothetical protein